MEYNADMLHDVREEGYQAGVAEEAARCKRHCEQAVKEFRDKAIKDIQDVMVRTCIFNDSPDEYEAYCDAIEIINKLPLTNTSHE